MLEMASLGAKVLQTRSVELAMGMRVPVRVLSSFVEPDEHGNLPPKSGTLICDEEEIVEKRIVSGVTMSRDEARDMLIKIAAVRQRDGLDEETTARLKKDFDMLKARTRKP
jgi:aspartate kinase